MPEYQYPGDVHVTADGTPELEHELRKRITAALDLPDGSVGVIVGTGLILVKVARENLLQAQRRVILGVLTGMGLGGNLFHILEP